MADICIVYARKDARSVLPALEEAFGRNWSVWWDRDISEGDYRKVIVDEISKSGCLVPIWSAEAEHSPTLFDEVKKAQKFNVPVLPIRIHDVDAPLGFGPLQATDILGWKGEGGRIELKQHINRITKTLNERRNSKTRPVSLGAGEASRLPLLFYSVSSHETQLQPLQALNALDVFDVKPVLISAYDFEENRRDRGLIRKLERRQKKGGIILLDSGNYEKTRREDGSWKFNAFRKTVKETPHDFLLTYDESNPGADLASIVDATIRAYERDSKITQKPVIPIVHLHRLRNGDYDLADAPMAVRRVAEAVNPSIIAIPERELGAGIFARAATIHKIRAELKKLKRYQPVHILGTGNPRAMALFAAAGADSFDGLEWCRYVIDGETSTLHHFQHYELFKWQDEHALSPIARDAVNDESVHHAGKAVFHNLDFYTSWIEKLRVVIQNEKRLVEFMTKLFPKSMEQASQALPDLL